MPERQRFRVYLAGPIHGCNDDQLRRWRDTVVQKYGSHFTFSNPSDRLLGNSATPYQFVETDLRAIEDADGLLVNMWRESIGSAIGVVHAHRKGKPVVVADPNHLNNRMLDFYADAVEATPLKAANALLDLLRAEAHWRVIKSGGRGEEPFLRRKLVTAIRSACRSTGRDDLVVPRLVLPGVLERLRRTNRQIRKRFAAGEIDNEVIATFAALEDDPQRRSSVSGVSATWKHHQHDKQRVPQHPRRREVTSDGAVHVEISSTKSHSTIWGKSVKQLDDIPSSDAKQVFRAISKVPGITRIVLGPFGHKGSRLRCAANVSASSTPFVIDGQLFDRARKGTMQSFQVRTQSETDKEVVVEGITATLKALGRWAG